MNETLISDDLMQAYEATNFKVLSDPPFILNIGKPSKEVSEIFTQTSTSCAAYITAFNPYSETMSDAENIQAHKRLISQLAQDGYEIIDAIGEDPNGEWPGETSVFVFQMSKEHAIKYGRQFRQNAIVWIDNKGVPELVTLR